MNKPVTFFLLRGLARETRHWIDFPERLENTGEDNRAVPLEIPGAGGLRDIQAPLRIADYLQPLRQQYRKHVREGCDNILIGLSLGGMIAAQWVHDYAGDFSGAVLINSSCNASSLTDRLLPGAAADLLRATIHRDCRQQEQRIAERICNLADTAEITKRWTKICRDAPMKTGNKLRQLVAAIRFRLPPKPALPVLILCAEKDRLTAPSCSQEIAKRWRSPIFSHDLAGHDLPTDDPDWCTSTILSWTDHYLLR